MTRAAPGPFGSPPASGLFFQNDSSVANASFNSTNLVCWQVGGSCNPYYDPYTYSESTSPNLLALPNGDVGLSYQTLLNTSQTICGWTPNETISHVAFAVSANGGVSWGTPSYLGDSGATCPYNEEIEPSFATNSFGSVLGVYVAANTSLDAFGNVSTYQGTVPDPIAGYVTRSSDALIFVNSTDSGATFSTGTTLVTGGNLARPAIAASGRTIYIAYEDINNSTTLLPDNNSPIAVHLLVSTDSGATWGTPLTLPGENASEGYTAMSPSLSVSATGALAVAYVTNRSCIAMCTPLGAGSEFGDDVVAATSTDNGTSWTMTTIYRATGEPVAIDCNGPCTKASIVYGNLQQPGVSELSALFEYAPPTSVSWNTTGPSLFVAWGGAANTTQDSQGCFYGGCDFAYQSLYEATSPDGGHSWSWQQLGAVGGSQNPSNTIFYNKHTAFAPLSYYDLSLSVSAGVVYLAFQSSNQSLTPSEVSFQNGGIEAQCGFSTFDGYNGATIEWLMNSTGGTRWSSPLPAVIEGAPVYWTNLQPYLGYSSSVLVQNGQPMVASSLPPICPTTGCSLNFGAAAYDTTSLDVAIVDHAATVTLTISESGLPSGTPWSVQVSGNSLSGTGSSFVVKVPAGTPFYVDPAPFTTALGVRYVAYTPGGEYSFSANGTVTIDFTSVQPFELSVNGALDNFLYLEITNSTWGFGYYNVSQILIVPTCIFSCASGALFVGCPMPWYFPTGFVLNVTNSDLLGANLTLVSSAVPTYWAGTGAGNYTGTHLPYSVTLNDPINETMWTLPLGYYGVKLSAPTLPASSTFSFDWDGTAMAGGPGGGSVVVGNVPTGAHEISSITGTSSQVGWIYVGSVPGGATVLVPQQLVLNLSFAYVDVGAPSGTVSFHAQNLTNGTSWQLQFNGTTYSSSTPWINVTTHPGTYSIYAGTATSPNGSIGYVATGVGAEVSVAPGSVVPLNYSPAYKVTIAASSGGVVAPSGVNWYLPGQTTSPLVAAAASGFSFAGWSGTGAGSYNGTIAQPVLTVGGPIVELASFAPLPPDRFDLNFTQTGIPAGVAWQVDVAGTPYSSEAAELSIPGLDAAPTHYAFTVPDVLGTDPTNATRYVSATGSGNVYAGTNFDNALAYSVQYYLTLASTTGGSSTALVGSTLGGSTWFTSGTTVGLGAQAASGYTFVGWVGTGPGSYTGSLEFVPVTPSGSLSELATFAALQRPGSPTYTVELQLAQPFAPGTDWTVTIGGSTYASTGSELNVSGLAAGTIMANLAVAYAPDGLAEYTPQNAVLSIRVAAGIAPVEVPFLTAYWVEIQTVGAGTVSSGSGWVSADQARSFLATPASGDVLLSWTGTGLGAYSGASEFANVTADGPITEVAAFAPESGPSAIAPAGGTFWTSGVGVAALALIGLVVGVALGLLWFRGRSRRPPARSNDLETRGSTEEPAAADLESPSPRTSPRSLPRAPSLRRTPSGASAATVAVIVGVAALMLLSGLAGLGSSGAPPAVAPGSPAASAMTSVQPAGSPPPPSSGAGTFWLNTPMPNVTTNDLCLGVATSYYYANQLLCGATNITNEPSLNLSTHGVLVAAYTAYTNQTPCEAEYPLLANYTYTEIGLTTSTNGGTSWSTPQYLGNTVCTNATVAGNFLNAWQPTVTSLANGTLVVAFVEFNLSYPTGCTSCYYPFPKIFSNDWKYNYNGLSDYNSSQLVVSFSYDDGTSWTSPTPVNTSTTGGGPWCASGCQTYANWIQQKPSITAFGQTLYLTWTNITQGWYAGWFYDGYINHYGGRNYCTLFHSARYCPAGQSGVQLAVSLNGSPNFGAPIELPVVTTPGSNFSSAANPSALVSPSGTLVVAYLSNLSVNSTLPSSEGSCAVRGSCGGFLSSVLVAQSSDNGTSWTVGTAANNVYDSQDYDAGFYFIPDVQDSVNAGDRLLPAPVATYDPVSQQVIVAFTADLVFPYCPSAALVDEQNLPSLCDSYAKSEVYVANGSLSTNTWSSRLVTAWSGLANSTPNGMLDSYFYNPAIVSTSDGTIYLTAQFVNGSACTSVPGNAYLAGLTGIVFYGFQSGAFPYCGEGLELYGTSIDNGTSFSLPMPVDPTGTWYEEMPPGLHSSMVSAGNEVWVAWTQTLCPDWNGPNQTKCNMLWDASGSYPPEAGFTSNTTVVVSQLVDATGVTVTFQEHGLPLSTNWSVNLSQNDRSGDAGSNLSVSGVPTGVNETWNASIVPDGPGVRYVGSPSVPSPGTFTAATTIVWTYVLQYALTLNTTPAFPAGIGSKSWFEGAISCDGTSSLASWENSYFFDPNGVCNDAVTTINYNLSFTPGITWIDAGTPFTIQAIPLNASMYLCPNAYGCESNYANLTFQAWTGLGAGAYNGTANRTTLTLAGPVEETATFELNAYCIWGDGGYVTGGAWLSSCLPGGFTANFVESGLPSGDEWGVSVWGSGLNQTMPFPATTTSSELPVDDPALTSLVYFQADTVPSGTSGEVFAATANPGSPLLGPLDSSSLVHYSLSSVDSLPFPSMVRAAGLPNGTAWSFSVDGVGAGVNGSVANVTVTGGTHTLSASPVYFSNGTGYVAHSIDIEPFVINETWTNSTASGVSYDFNGSALILVNFTPVDELTAQASPGGSIRPDGTSWIASGATVTLTASADRGSHFVAWTGVGYGAQTSSNPSISVIVAYPISEYATFAPNASAVYVVTVTATGLLSGGSYSVVFNGTTYSGSGAFALPGYPGGDYSISVPIAYDNSSSLVRFLPTSFSTTLPLGSGGTYDLAADGGSISISFATQYALEVGVSGPGTIRPGPGELWETSANRTSLTATPSVGALFVGWSGTGIGSVNSTAPSLTVTTIAAMTEAAQFAPSGGQAPGTYNLTVIETGLPQGTPWSFSAGVAGAGSHGATASVSGLNGSYELTVPTVRISVGERYTSNVTNRSVSVSANRSVSVAFSHEFLLTVVAGPGGSVTPGTEWLAEGSTVALGATALTAYSFAGWMGSGAAGNYSGSAGSGPVTMNGAITETAVFTTTSGAANSSPSGSGGGTFPAYVPWVALAVLFVVGLLAVYALQGRGARPPSSSPSSQGPRARAGEDGPLVRTEPPTESVPPEGGP